MTRLLLAVLRLPLTAAEAALDWYLATDDPWMTVTVGGPGE